ncbi:MAG: hypothetical protein IPM98_15685 [Lewinellaceae bacterium]|nr:hypothetical protein [Lewinellaceae bacterium]
MNSYKINLGSGDSMTAGNPALTLPKGIEGTWYVWALSDSRNNIPEDNETNNIGMDSIQIELTPWPDLQVTDLSGVPPTAEGGTEVPLTFTIKNFGTGGAGESYWRDRVYISPDSVWNLNTAILLKEVVQTPVLQPGAMYARNVTVQIPSPGAQSSATRYLYIRTDADNTIYEFTGEKQQYPAQSTYDGDCAGARGFGSNRCRRLARYHLLRPDRGPAVDRA